MVIITPQWAYSPSVIDQGVEDEVTLSPEVRASKNEIMLCYGTTDFRFCFANKDSGLMTKLHQAFLNYLCKYCR